MQLKQKRDKLVAMNLAKNMKETATIKRAPAVQKALSKKAAREKRKAAQDLTASCAKLTPKEKRAFKIQRLLKKKERQISSKA